jgi:hypothetical protein
VVCPLCFFCLSWGGGGGGGGPPPPTTMGFWKLDLDAKAEALAYLIP